MTFFLNVNPKTVVIAALAGTSLMLSACSAAQTEAKTNSSEAAQRLQVKHVDAQGAQALLLANPDAVVLDVRTPKEIEDGHIQGAVFADFLGGNFKENVSRLDKSAPYIIHCKGGGRSTKALSILETMGFTNITHMDGGLDGWKRADLPLTRP